jgi:hypothetical protein
MADYSAIREYFDSENLNYFTFYPKSQKPVKAVIRHLPIDKPAEDMSNGLQDLGYSVLCVKQITASRPYPEGDKYTFNLPLFLVTLTKDSKSPEIFKPMPHSSYGGSLQDPERFNSVFQLPEIWPYLGKLQAATPVHVV